jgi:Calx-beta domain
VTVQYATADGTATAGSDYQSISNTLTFGPGEISKSVTIAISGDTAVEPNEIFFVNLSGASGATISDGQGVGTIVNDDLPALSINSIFLAEGNSGYVNAVFTVSLAQTSPLTVTVNYATASGTAKNGSDYLPQSGSLTFNPGETNKTITVKIKSDTTVEPDETIFVNLTAPFNATLAVGQGVGTILNDDGLGGVALTQQSGSANLLLTFVTDTSGSSPEERPARLRRAT